MAQAAAASPEPHAIFQAGQLQVDNLSLRYLEAGQGHSQDHSIVILDSLGLGLTKLHHALAASYHVVALELPGFGASPPNTTHGSVLDLAKTSALAASILANGAYTLIGTSFSANVALWHALHAQEAAPDDLETLVLISPTALLPSGVSLGDSPEQLAGQLFAHPEAVSADLMPDQQAIAQEQTLMHRLQGAAHDGEAERRLGEIQCATLVVFGLEDKLVAPEAGRIYREQIPDSNLSLVYDAGHLIVPERPEALTNAVSDYVERRETFIVGRREGLINP